MHGWLRRLRWVRAQPSSHKLDRSRPVVEILEDRRLLASPISEFSIPSTVPAASPYGITNGPDGNLWFTEQGLAGANQQIGQVTTAAAFQFFNAGTNLPFDIITGPDGALWFVETGQVGHITTNGVVSQLNLPANSAPLSLTAGPNSSVWVTNSTLNELDEFTIDGLARMPLTTKGFPEGIVNGPDGNMWFTNPGNNSIDEFLLFNPASQGLPTEFPLPTPGSQPARITVGSDNALWFTESGSNKIGRIDPTTGVIKEFALPTANSNPFEITAGPDGALWFTEKNAGQIGRITTSGQVMEFAIPTGNSQPIGITSGPDGNIWFTESATNKIGKFDVKLLFFTGAGVEVCSFAGVPLNNVPVATFSDTMPSDLPATYTATINWGDGTVTAGTVTKTGATTFSVSGSHTYAIEGTLPVTVKVTRSTDGEVLTVDNTAMVGGYVTSLYENVLERAPDPAGLNVWLQALNGGLSRSTVAEDFWESPEHRGIEVDQFYATFLHRPADSTGRAAWVNALVNGVSEAQVAINFLTSPEYTATHADAAAYVAGLYTDIFGRTADSAGQSYWTSVIQNGARSRADVAFYFLSSTESYLHAVDQYYETYLGRAPSSQEEQVYLPLLINGTTPGTITAIFLSSEEFINREIALSCGS